MNALRTRLIELGCPLSRERIRQMLTDTIYSDGKWGVTSEGIFYPGRDIGFSRPIPLELIKKNAELLSATKAIHKRDSFGINLLNYVEVVHAKCMDSQVMTRHGVMATPRLTVQAYGDKRSKSHFSYLHTPRSPIGCRGYGVPAKELESAVIDALLELASNKELQRFSTNLRRLITAASRQMETTSFL